MKKEWKLLLDIFITFFKIAPVTFGGGYAMIPVIEREIVTKKQWLEEKDLTDVFALAGSVPGAVAINSATFTGYRVAGVKGALAATIGVIIPTFLIVLLLGIFYITFKDNPKVDAAFEGIRPAVVAMIAFAAYKLKGSALIDKTTITAFILSVFLLLFFQVHPMLLIIGSAFCGIILVNIRAKLGKKTPIENKEQQLDYFMGANI
ncbi:chromate transporter [Domibacillus robiginosus]|uniref:chromate transporter n=1 Tax=Domibacillus robiginosus TaxID=1071054 RepID=UPI00067C5D7C|nr:chromate transporter [Domibacillus robiginosus]